MNRGFVFTLDALIAALILISGILLVSKAFIADTNTIELQSVSEDTANLLDVIPTKESTDPVTIAELLNGSITDGNVSILNQIGYYWAQGDLTEARNLAQFYLDKAYPNGGIRLSIENTVIYERNGTGSDVLVTKRMITGIAEGEAITGSSASAYLRKIKSKRTAAFIPFGGFLGEGNFSVVTTELPSDANVTDIIVEGDFQQPMMFFINGNACDTLTPTPTFLTPSTWNFTNCTSFMNPAASNTLSFNYTETMNGSYVAGGFVKVLYTTDEINSAQNESIYNFPAIAGLINLYDGFYIDGNVSDMNITLHFQSNYTSYLTVGNASWQFAGSAGEQTITINESEVASTFASVGMNVSEIGQQTIPLRFGIGSVVVTGAPSDTVMVTDTSGSMEWCSLQSSVDCYDSCGCGPCSSGGGTCGSQFCGIYSTCASGDVERLVGAQNATNSFIDFMLNNTGPLIGLAEFGSSTKSSQALSDNATLLQTLVNGYTHNGGTCICCGVNTAIALLTTSSSGFNLVTRSTSGWKYNTDDLGSPPAGWTTIAYDDSSWRDGTTPIGFLYGGLGTSIPCCSQWYVGDYFYRKNFTVVNATDIASASLFAVTDDGADIYVNGNLIDNDYGDYHSAFYWNRNNISINPSFLVEGENVVAVRQWHGSQWWRPLYLDVEITASYNATVEARTKNIIVMTDGQAGTTCSEQPNSTATADAIQSACDAYQDSGINVYTVGFGADADTATLQSMANCGNGEYFAASNATALNDVFSTIAGAIIDSSSTQAAIIEGTPTTTYLFSDSQIDANYTTTQQAAQPNEIEITVQTDQLANCSDIVELYSGVRFLDAVVNSYSGDFWTSEVNVNGATLYNLSQYATTFTSFGDPYQIHIPVANLVDGNNTFNVSIGSDGTNISPVCSSNNSAIYTIAVNLSTERTQVVSNAEGCNWVVAFIDNSTLNLTVPTAYVGNNSCAYLPGNITYDDGDAYQLGVAQVLQNLDFKNEGMLSISLEAQDLEIVVTTIDQVPYLWGPALATLEVWR
ncbi:MAG: VWA domain-containing protein [Candidatus Woesearchaeota archaeon]|nr:VWA domain-containing protein [Candidatus Woesearchaeota archaeon]